MQTTAPRRSYSATVTTHLAFADDEHALFTGTKRVGYSQKPRMQETRLRLLSGSLTSVWRDRSYRGGSDTDYGWDHTVRLKAVRVRADGTDGIEVALNEGALDTPTGDSLERLRELKRQIMEHRPRYRLTLTELV